MMKHGTVGKVNSNRFGLASRDAITEEYSGTDTGREIGL